LKVDGRRVVDEGGDPPFVEVRPQRLALFYGDDVEVIDVVRVRRRDGPGDGQAFEAPVVERGIAPASLVPLVEVGRLDGKQCGLKLGHACPTGRGRGA